jgi:hypothetical protein
MTDQPKTHGGKRPGAGRPALGKVKLTCWVVPETRAKLGSKPGEMLDRIVKGSTGIA